MNHTTDNYKSLAISIVALAVLDVEGYSRYIEKRKGNKQFKIFTQIKNFDSLEDYLEEHKKLMRYLATHSMIARKGLSVAIEKEKNCFSAVNFLNSTMCEEICEVYHGANDILVKCKRKYKVI